MSFRLLYVDNADVVGQADSFQQAYDELRRLLDEHPELDDDIGIQEVDELGRPVGDMTVGLEIAGQQLLLN
jgi:hypothetical protein